MVVVCHKAPAARKQGLNFQPLLLASLRAARAVRVEKASFFDAKIGVLNRSVLEWFSAECSALEDAAAAHELRANRGVHPRVRSQIKSITQNKALARALADIGNQETRCPHFAARGSSRVRKPYQGHAEKTEVSVDERDGLIQANARVGRVELPLGMLGVADSDPRTMNKVDISRKALDVPCLEVQRIIGNQEHRIGPPLDLYGSPNVVKEAVTRADVVVSFVGFEMLVAVVKLNVPGRRGFVGFSVVFDVVSAKAGVPVMDVHVAVGSCDIAFAALCFRLQISDSTLGGRQAALLRRRDAWRRGCEYEKQCTQERKNAERGGKL